MRKLKKDVWPYNVKVNKNEFSTSVTEMEIWLGEQLGTYKGRWIVVYQSNETYFYFREGKDATMFSLRWA